MQSKNVLVDLSSVVWTSLMAGEDKEFGRKVLNEAGKPVQLNSATHGFDNAVNHIVKALTDHDLVPRDMTIVEEGKNSKGLRTRMYEGYKNKKDGGRTDEHYVEFNALKGLLIAAFKELGATVVTQDNVEADDIIAYLAENLKGEVYILTNDGDLSVLVNERVHHIKALQLDVNPFGPFDFKYITLYKALVGDTSDTYPGAKGFGEKAFFDLLTIFGESGLDAIIEMIQNRNLKELTDNVKDLKAIQKILDAEDMVYTCWGLAMLYPERVNTLLKPLEWFPGMVVKRTKDTDPRLKHWAGMQRIITADTYPDAIEYMQDKLPHSPDVTLDLETSTPDESDDWIKQRSDKGTGVDVLASKITGCGLTFGNNGQYQFYFSVDHVDTDNVSLDQLREALELIPQTTPILAANAGGFELPVLYKHFGEVWKDNGWRGFLPNVIDTQMAATHQDENRFSQGLKALSKEILGYDQVSYDEVTTLTRHVPIMVVDAHDPDAEPTHVLDAEGQPTFVAETYQVKMNQLSAKHVLAYGLDDVITTHAVYGFFKRIMEIESTFDAFLKLEQKPLYLSALSYVQGQRMSLERIQLLKSKDEQAYIPLRKKFDEFLIAKDWEGTVCPSLSEESTPAEIKNTYTIATGKVLNTMVRTVSKIALLMGAQAETQLEAAFAEFLKASDFKALNKLIAENFTAAPHFDEGSAKQMKAMLYDVMGLPIRLRNKATPTMKDKGIFEGTPRTDEASIEMAIKMGDASAEVKEILEGLMKMKSINTRTSLYWRPYPRFIYWQDGKIHPEFRQSSTNTRRWTGANPNFQQQDRDKNGVRSAVLPHHINAVVASLDLSGQEIRLAADYCRDENLLTCFLGTAEQLRDVHSIVACIIAGVTYEEFVAQVKSEIDAISDPASLIRGIAKIVLFASFYGAMAPKIAENLGISEEEAQKYIDTIAQQFPRLPEWKKEIEEFVETYGYVNIKGGTRRHLAKQIMSDNGFESSKARRQGPNAAIQGAGANQMKMIMSDIWDSNLLDDYDYRWMFPVHDETVHSIGKDDVAAVVPILHGIMTQKFLDIVPSASSIGLGRNFGQLIEIGEVCDPAKLQGALDKLFAEVV